MSTKTISVVLGQACGCAASLAVARHETVQEIDYQVLCTTLLDNWQIVEIPGNWLEIITSNDSQNAA